MENLTTPQPNIPNKPTDVTVQDFKINTVEQQLKYPLDYTTVQALREALGLSNVSVAFPIGSIFISVVSTNPATTLGYGTWSAFATGKTLIGVDTGEVRFDTVEETGGSITHTITNNELPANVFNVQGGSPGAWGVTAGSTYGTVTGGAAPFDILPPYITVYMWKRDS